MKKVLIVGAGRLGKGFLGEVFAAADWQVSFLDKDAAVIDEMKNGYTVKIYGVDSICTREVRNYDAYLCSDKHKELSSFLEADIVMLPLYPDDLEDTFQYLLYDLKQQMQNTPDKKLDMVLLTNMTYLTEKLCAYVKNLTDTAFYTWFHEHIFLRDAIIRRSTDAADDKANRSVTLTSMAAASLLIEQPLHTDLGNVQWMEPAKNVPTLKEIKIFTLNGPHAATAYAGAYYGYEDIPTASSDPQISRFVEQVAQTINQVCMKEFHVTEKELENLSRIPKLKGELPDSVFRVGYDPIRKLGNADRLCGPLKLCLKHHVDALPLIKAIAYALHYQDAKDENSIQLQRMLTAAGTEKTVIELTQLPQNIVMQIVEEYNSLKKS